MKKFLLLLILLTTSYIFSQETVSDIPKIVIKLPLNETLQLNIGSVTFLEIIEDSRCPKEVTCIWSGRAKVRVAIQKKDKETYQKEIIIGELLEGESSNKVLFSTEDHTISVIDLYPLPSSNVDQEDVTFELLVHIERK